MKTPTINEPIVARMPHAWVELYIGGGLCAALKTPEAKRKGRKVGGEPIAFAVEQVQGCHLAISFWKHTTGTQEVVCKLWVGGLCLVLSRADAEQVAKAFAPEGLEVVREAWDCTSGTRGRTTDPEALAKVAAPV